VLVAQDFEIIEQINKAGTTIFMVEQNANTASQSPTAVTSYRWAGLSSAIRRKDCLITLRCVRLILAKSERAA
jgi:hypothetical protein